ncbi:MAG: rhomboid family intramembrane serine protease [Gemmatimonadetes bacterium]|nr:rhomboid family intramembrane serine protease [Gemmatimonadota bacterium]
MTFWVRNLLIANVVMFLITMSAPGLADALVFVPALITRRPWTVVTYMFLHANITHILFNMLALYFFGSRVELRLGGRRFLALYFISGLMGALLSLFFTPRAAIVGASGAIFGVMLGYARYWPRDLVYIWGVFPVQARWMVIAMTVLSLYGGFGATRSMTAHFAHLGGFLGGFLYLLWADRHSPAKRFREQAGPTHISATSSDVERWSRISGQGLHPLNREELERLLQKIARGEAASLTPDERAFLDRLEAAQ